jgi:2-dehydro-3-deoxyphosphooctonate aldolase (KDO 8-P synthase)
MNQILEIGNLKIGGGSFFFVGGPCVIESEEITFETAERIKEICEELEIPFIFKSSYLKDNRSSLESYQGPGLEKGLEILKKIKEKIGVPVLSDVHSVTEVDKAKEVLDVLQLPAFLSMQTSLTVALAKTKKTINVKKGQFLSPYNVKNIINKIEKHGNKNIILTERGNFFGYNNLVVDMRSIKILKSFGYPVLIDAGHSVRMYGFPSSSPEGGEPEFIPLIARAGIAAGADGLFLEVHPEPKFALCDASTQFPLSKLKELLKFLKELKEFMNKNLNPSIF